VRETWPPGRPSNKYSNQNTEYHTSINWSYTGNSQISVDDSKSAEGSQSLKIYGSPGGCWESIPCRLLEVSTSEDFQISFYIYISSNHVQGCHGWTGDAGFKEVCSTHTQATSIVSFGYDGTINSRIGNLGTYNYDTWYKISMKYEREDVSSVKLSYWINGNLVGSQSVPSESYEDNLLYLHYSSGDGTVWIDDIEVSFLEQPACDINEDGAFTFQDIAMFFKACKEGTAEWECDLNGDGSFSIADIVPYIRQCRQPEDEVTTIQPEVQSSIRRR